jgi:hypothetical protein
MLRAIILVFAAGAILGQTPPPIPETTPPQTSQQAPPDVDAALRARITQFYQLEVEGKFYQALQLVAEDTKDRFVGSSKPASRGFQIQSIKYSDDFTKAEVVVLVDRMLPLEGFMGHPLPTKTPSRWKLENGQWCYYMDSKKDFPMTPFGPRPPRPKNLPADFPTGGPSGAPPGAPRPPLPMPGNFANPGNLASLPPLTVDKLNVQLKASGSSAEQVTISNPLPWPAILAVTDPKVAGLTVKLDPSIVKPSEKAILSIAWSGAVPVPTAPITIAVTVQQTRQIIPIKVSFAN